jgi:hypothetical protein
MVRLLSKQSDAAVVVMGFRTLIMG